VDLVIQYADQPPGVSVGVTMPPQLMQAWQQAGGTVTGGEVVGNQLRATAASQMVIGGIPLAPGEQADVTLDISGPTETPFVVGAVEMIDGQAVGGNVYVYEGLLPEESGGTAGLAQSDTLLLVGLSLCLCLFVLVALAVVYFFFIRR
jgi:hypothetical protein